MKIIKEIEKSRLTENGMQVITGGATNPGDQCSEEVTYRSCGSIGNIHFNVVPCAVKLSCPTAYYTCSGPGSDQLLSCTTPTGNNYSKQY